jgi:hypothetical protein
MKVQRNPSTRFGWRLLIDGKLGESVDQSSDVVAANPSLSAMKIKNNSHPIEAWR